MADAPDNCFHERPDRVELHGAGDLTSAGLADSESGSAATGLVSATKQNRLCDDIGRRRSIDEAARATASRGGIIARTRLKPRLEHDVD